MLGIVRQGLSGGSDHQSIMTDSRPARPRGDVGRRLLVKRSRLTAIVILLTTGTSGAQFRRPLSDDQLPTVSLIPADAWWVSLMATP